jgi:hypothetical protein
VCLLSLDIVAGRDCVYYRILLSSRNWVLEISDLKKLTIMSAVP